MLLALIVAAALAVLAGPARAATPHGMLAVPYVAQSELLCGGAAVAMVERWWGRRGVYAEDFAALVDRRAGGIRTTDLVTATEALGWQVQALHGTPDLIRQSLDDSVPVIALIQVGRHRYHFVVIVGWSDTQVVFHDPAVAPFATLSVTRFLQRWHGADEWAMVVRPSLATVTGPRPAVLARPGAIDSLPCRPWLDRAADAAAANHLDDADHLLAEATAACPGEPLVQRELAGVRFRQGRMIDAAQLATAYLQRIPRDTLGWQVLASSRYLAGDVAGALDAWNAVDRPAVDLVRIDGTRHIRFGALADAIDIAPRAQLTSSALALSRRRVNDIPALAAANVSYVAVPGGVVEVQAAVIERPLLDPLPQLLVGEALHAAIRQEIGFGVNTPLGMGDQWIVQWRWEAANPRQAVRVDIPARLGLPGIVGLESSWEQYHFAPGIADERRRTAAFAFSNWLTPAVESRLAARYEQWSAQGDYLAFAGGGGVHELHDQLALTIEGEAAVPLGNNLPYTRVRVHAAARSRGWSATWSGRVGFDWTSANAPQALWPVAGGDLARDVPLRAYSFIMDDALPTARIGQGMVHGGLSADHPVAHLGLVVFGAGLFVDAADVIRRGTGIGGSQWYADGGAGIRIAVMGAPASALRIDIARGMLTDPRWGLTVGFDQPAPRILGFH